MMYTDRQHPARTPQASQPAAPGTSAVELTEEQLTTVVGASIIVHDLTATGGATPLRPFVPCI